ncbi:MAG: Ni/Fe hydrogenase subunit alpha [Candidatus Heimdallarchaeota archaeon]|nr:Ni/Fe hydrogenase subunit alpha [Candidatus Heimdallarchaeota archaeon]
MTKKTITINPVTRLEGEAKISIFLDDKGNAEDAYFQVVELRGFEKFCEGRCAEEMPRIVSRICGVCPWPHHIASSKVLDQIFHVTPAENGVKLRRMGIAEHIFYSHSAHFFALAGPDLVLGVGANPADRNLLGLLRADKDLVVEVLKQRQYSHRIQEIIGGKSIHPITAIPGGMSRAPTEEERQEIIHGAQEKIKFCQFALDMFDDLLKENKDLEKLVTGNVYKNEFNYLATVNEKNQIDYYGGDGVIINPEGKVIDRFKPENYDEHISEHTEPWCTAKQTFLKELGWKGLVSGSESGIYSVGPLARLNIAEYSTPLAREAQKKIFELVPKPCHLQLVANWARLVEMLNASEIVLNIAEDSSITSGNYRTIPKEIGGRGIGIVEAPRGTLIHDYTANSNGVIEKVNLIVATTHNIAPINISVREAAKQVIKKGNYDEQAVLNQVEVAFRSYDPCLACATHTPTGSLPLEVKIFDENRKLKDVLKRK